MPRTQKAAFAAGAVALCLLLFEAAARLVDPPTIPASQGVSARLYREKMVNRWILPAWERGQGECRVYQDAMMDGRTSAHMAAEVAVSASGLRDTPLSGAPPAGQQRLLVLGDSSIFGVGLCRLDTLPELLERELNQGLAPVAGGARAVEVINAGVPGYSSYQSLEQMGRLMEQGVGPHGVIIYNMISDFAGPSRLDDDAWFAAWAPVMGVLGRSAMVRWLDRLAVGTVTWRHHQGEHDANEYHDHNRVSLTRYMDNLRAMIRRARAAGAWVLLVIPPLHQDIRPRPGHESGLPPGYQLRTAGDAEPHQRHISQRLEELAAGRRASAVNEDYRSAMALVAWQTRTPLFDGSQAIKAAAARAGGGPALEKRQPASLMLDDVHPAPAGNKALAQALLPLIKKLSAKSQ